jgi:Ca2+:H+ antiporter
VIPLAGLIGRATESLSAKAGGAVGALLNATFGTFAELVIAALLVIHGQIGLVRASVVGSLVGNILLLLGVAVVVAAYDRLDIPFNRGSRVQATLLFVAVGIFLLPTMFSLRSESTATKTGEISDVIAVLLIVLYALALLFMFRTHRSVLRAGGEAEKADDPQGEAGGEPETEFSTRLAVVVLAVSTVLVTVGGEIVSGSVEETGRSLGLTTGFLGFIVLPLIGNAAEQFSALSLAAKDRLDVASDIAVSASMQLVMLVVPVLVLVGLVSGHQFRLVFDKLELAILFVSTLLVRQLVDDRQAHWFEGAMLLGLYAAFAASAFFVGV